MTFTILKQSTKSRARLGSLETAHGVVETPAFVPVATNAVVRTLTSSEASAVGSQLLIANTFHLHFKPGERIVKRAGGLNAFMGWNRPLMTDSGGFQVFSLGFGKDHGVGKIATVKSRADKTELHAGAQPQSLKITQEGVHFRSPLDGQEFFLGPKESMAIQSSLGADIIFAFDECTSPLAGHTYTKQSLGRTHAWARQSLAFRNERQALFGIVQGGRYKDLRLESARAIGALPFDGFGIGGEFGNTKATMVRMLRWVIAALPEDKPRHLLGIGHLEDIPKIIRQGVDLFDCIAPTHYGRHGVAFTSHGRLDCTKRIVLNDRKPLDARCACVVCTTTTRSYIAHLVRAHEITGLKLLTFHNLFYFNAFVGGFRNAIQRGAL